MFYFENNGIVMFYDLMFMAQLLSKLIYDLTAFLNGPTVLWQVCVMTHWSRFKVINVRVQSNKCVIWLRPQTMRMKLYVFMFYVLCLLFELVLKYEIYLKMMLNCMLHPLLYSNDFHF